MSVNSPSLAQARPSAFIVWLSAIRPQTLTASLAPVAVGTALALQDGKVNWLIAITALLGAIMIQIGTNFFNDYSDFKKGADTEDRLGPARATQKGWVTPKQMLVATVVAFVLAGGIGLFLSAVGGWPILLIGVFGILSGLAYTGGPYPLAYVGLGDLFVMLFFGNAAVCGTYFAQTGEVTLASVLASFAVGAFATAILVVNNLRDRNTDLVANKRTLAVRFGASFARLEYAIMVFGPYVIVVLVSQLDIGHTGWLLPLLTLPLALYEFKSVLVKDGAALNAHLGGAARLGVLFSLLLAGGIAL
ncbi:MAG: 1,4-dihydroxy-2-naphthoate polyprenyltransferase [Planctomycetota bacterium]|nr:1,4-dihydroxy-2-naphthoate polyprenyltransferase [Planctomycetota bacterium]